MSNLRKTMASDKRLKHSNPDPVQANPDLERSYLGGVILRADLYCELDKNDFSVPIHRLIFAGVSELQSQRALVSLSSLHAHLGARETIKPDEVPYLASLIDGIVPEDRMDSHRIATKLRELRIRREACGAAERIERRAADPAADVSSIIASLDETSRHLRELSLVRVGPGTLDGASMLDSISRFIKRFVSLTDPQVLVLALWVVHTHAFDAASSTPYLAISSPEKQCGKTRLLEVLGLLTRKPWMTGRVTAAALVRKIDKERPTLLLDEADAAFGQQVEYTEALRSILNTGYQRGGGSSVCVGKGADVDVKDFETFCPKALAGIGRLPDTVQDRSIPIVLRRKPPGQQVERFRVRVVGSVGSELSTEAASWVRQNLDGLRHARPDLPETLSDRRQDVCEPLLAIADAAGGDWPSKARTVIVQVFDGPGSDDQSIRVQLLTDIRRVFEESGRIRETTVSLLETLISFEASPWVEYNRGKPISPHGLSRLLKPFQIAPKVIRLNADSTARGYERAQFEEAWKSYLPSLSRIESVTASQHSIHAELAASLSRNTNPCVSVPQSDAGPHEHCTVTPVTLELGTEERGETVNPVLQNVISEDTPSPILEGEI